MEVVRTDVVRMSHSSAVAEVRRIVADHGRAMRWHAEATGTASLIATELATNLVKHARDGLLIFNRRVDDACAHLQMVAADRGPGMTDVARCLEDGYSTAGSPGTGFGAVRRMSSAFDVLSTPGKGTIVVAEYSPGGKARAQAERMKVGALSVPREGEQECGDAWASKSQGDLLLVMVCDGLGHGGAAAVAARAATEVFRTSIALEPKALMERAHEALRPTRGAALAFTAIDLGRQEVRFCGVGNISAVLVHTSGTRHLVSHNGIVGHRAARIAEFISPWQPGTTLLMHSDGVSARWRPEEWPGLWLREPVVVAATLWRDHGRGTDDATVLVAREAR